jgi:hypothetical protein
MARINGIQASAIAGLGQIGVGGGSPSPTPVTYPTGGLIANSGFFGNYDNTIISANGQTGSQPPWFDRPTFGADASTASVWTKIVGNINTTIYCLSSSGELFSAGVVYNYTGRTSVGFVAGRLDKVILVTPTSSWTDITIGTTYAIGINDGYLYGTGAPGNGQFGSGSVSFSEFGTWKQLSPNQGWIKVDAGPIHCIFMSGSGGSGSVWIAGSNANGRTGMNTTAGNTINRAEPFGLTGSIFTDIAAGAEHSLLLTRSAIFSTGENGNYQGGTGNTTDRTTFAVAAQANTYTSIYAGRNFSKAITIDGFHHHTGNQASSRGDGSTTQLTTFTRINTTGDLTDGWEKFYVDNSLTTYECVLGINNKRPYVIKGIGNPSSAIIPKSTVPYQSASYQSPIVAINTWVPFISGGNTMNITCSAAAFTNYNSLTTPYQPALWMYLTPQ